MPAKELVGPSSTTPLMRPPRPLYVVAKMIGGYTRESRDLIDIIGIYDDEEVAAKVRLSTSAQMFEVELNTLSPGLLANAAQLFGEDSKGFQYMASRLAVKTQAG